MEVQHDASITLATGHIGYDPSPELCKRVLLAAFEAEQLLCDIGPER